MNLALKVADPITQKYNPLEMVEIEKLRERLMKSSSDLSCFETAESFQWFIEVDGIKLGWISLFNLNKKMLTLDIGYGIAPEGRSKGIAKKAVKMISHEVFEKTRVRKISAYVHENNIHSIRVLESVGYKREGLLREHFLVNGIPASEYVYGLLRSDLSP